MRSTFVCAIEGNRKRERRFCVDANDDSRGEKSLSSFLSLVPYIRPSVRTFDVLRPFLFLRPWPMNADPLMRRSGWFDEA